MTILTYAEQLEQVQSAITKILTLGQSHGSDGRSMSRADLGALQEREKWLRTMVARETAGGITMRAGTPVDA